MLKYSRKRQSKNTARKPSMTFSYQEEWMKYNKNVKNNFLTFKAQNQPIGCHPKKTGEEGACRRGHNNATDSMSRSLIIVRDAKEWFVSMCLRFFSGKQSLNFR
jgi:hypothetical protein